ncbi:MAG: hypothetical protein DWQ36_15200 [Acidobacteria bacterium]|nr:MAG: hypothetical protein DWQ30_07805 [Acidobacteriota bacterium]REK05854.1 MAG: hypothetical protein DWQ36_15200 [Acidobacteriota bacterium]
MRPGQILVSLLIALILPRDAPVSAQSPEDLRSVAHRYVAAVAAMDYDEEQRFYDAESVFEDPTSVRFGDPWQLVGGESIVAFFRDTNTEYRTLGIEMRILEEFASPPFWVGTIRSTVTSCGVLTGDQQKSWTGVIDMVMVLELDGAVVRRRTDWADYAGAAETLDGIAAEAARRPDDPRCVE